MKEHKFVGKQFMPLTTVQALLEQVPEGTERVVVDGGLMVNWTAAAAVELVRSTIGPGGVVKELVLHECAENFTNRLMFAATAYGVREKVVFTRD